MKLKVKAGPNPFSSDLAVLIYSHFAVNIVVRLANSNGTVIRVKGCTLAAGENHVNLKNLTRYATGDYVVEIKLLNGDLLETIHLLKK